ncbi:hypothetical protein [Kurthia senegalensis]|uniref:hypothetical protein n=1 Tax=Kurthia senegalensis TaxID=1033740 RepID=UPI0002899F10|nr:hypothetical protein [Kurthia senegalensis]
MRICKLTEQNIYATNVESVINMFRYVLPHEDYCVRIIKENFRSLAAKKEYDEEDRMLIFSFKNSVFAVAELDKKIIDKNGLVVGIRLKPETLLIFYRAYDLKEFELHLRANQIHVNFVKTSQWNVISGRAERLLDGYLQKRVWTYMHPQK